MEDCAAVVDLQAEVWGESSDIVPASVLSISAKRGGILLGAWEGAEAGPPESLLGFVWSLAATREGEPTQWSHMLGVRPAARERGLGIQLKLAQRARAMEQGVDLIEWTFDPLQARNAHLNMTRLGCIASTYVDDAYGPLEGPLFSGTPTDRLVAEWWIRRPHVDRPTRLQPDAGRGRRRGHRVAAGGPGGVQRGLQPRVPRRGLSLRSCIRWRAVPAGSPVAARVGLARRVDYR